MTSSLLTKKRANDLDGKEWLRNSISIWSIAKNGGDRSFQHPAIFPEMLVSKLLDCFLSGTGRTVLDPFMGTGTTLVAACKKGHHGIGFEVYEEYIAIAEERLASFPNSELYTSDALEAAKAMLPETVDMLITSPPYWNILNRRRTADYKTERPYGTNDADIGNIQSYDGFVQAFVNVMKGTYSALKYDAYCVVNVMDIRLKNQLFTLHSDVVDELRNVGFKLDDIIIWDRRSDYNHLRPLGYPSKFRINRVHEYLLIFQKENCHGFQEKA